MTQTAQQAAYSPPTVNTIQARILARHDYMVRVRRPAEDGWGEIMDLLLPSSTPMVSSGLEGDETGGEIYTSDPVRYLRTCADGAMGGMVSPHFKWFAYAMDDLRLRRDDEVRKWLQVCDESMYYAYGRSNLYGVTPPHFRYALSIGNSVLLKHEEVKTGRLVFTCPHPRENYWLEDCYGRALPYHRLYPKTVSDILRRFPQTQDDEFRRLNMSEAFQSAVRNSNYYAVFELLHCIYSGEDEIFKGTDVRVNRPYMELYIEYDSTRRDSRPARPLEVSGYFTCPVNPWRLEKNDDEIYGRGIGHLALPDVREAGELRAATLVGIHKEMDPPIVSTTNLRGRLQKTPGGETYLAPSDWEAAGKTVARELYTRSQNWPAIIDFRRESDRGLREWFAVDYFLQLSNLAMEGSPPTATQILGMADEKAILLIGRLGRFDSDCFDNMMKSCFYTEYSAGRLPPAPPQVLAAGGPLPGVSYLGPLSQAQRRMHGVRNMINALVSVGPLFEANPKSVHKLRIPQIVEHILEQSGFPQELIVPQGEYEDIVAALAQQEQQIAQAELFAKVAKSIPSTQKETKPTSPMAMLTGATK